MVGQAGSLSYASFFSKICGIIGYVGHRAAAPILIEGLRRPEYRGYDSAGIAMLEPGSSHVAVRKRRGKLDEGLGIVPTESPAPGEFGISGRGTVDGGQSAGAGARRGSPLLIGLGENENFLASDAAVRLPRASGTL